jgi:hypothetical protein
MLFANSKLKGHLRAEQTEPIMMNPDQADPSGTVVEVRLALSRRPLEVFEG